MSRKSKDMLKMDDVRAFLIESFQKEVIHQMVIVKGPGAIDLGEAIDGPCHLQPIDLLFVGREFLPIPVLSPAKEMDLVTQMNQRLGEIKCIKLNPRIFFRRETVTDLKDVHQSEISNDPIIKLRINSKWAITEFYPKVFEISWTRATSRKIDLLRLHHGLATMVNDKKSCHCEERSDEAISGDCFPRIRSGVAMKAWGMSTYLERSL